MPATSLAVGRDTLGAFSGVICGDATESTKNIPVCSTLDAAGCAVQGRCSLHLPVTAAAAVGGRRSCACLLGVEEKLLLSLFALAVVGFLGIFRGADCLAVSIRDSDGGSVTGLRIVTQLLPIQVKPVDDI